MKDLLHTFQKQGGLELLKHYWRSGSFFTAVGELFLLGTSQTSLELLRLSTQLKLKQKLKKKYRKRIDEFNATYNTNLKHKQTNKVWVCWFQGIENAPNLVQSCFQSLKENLTDREIVLITFENMNDYAQFPDYILKKWKAGQISNTHMSDLLRLELLIRHGGMWVDATVLCSQKRKEIPDYYFTSDLFLYQKLKPGRNGNALVASTWLISATSNNKILSLIQYLCYEYWKENVKAIDYFLLHIFMSIVSDYYPEDWNQIVPCDNATPHSLLLRLFEKYNERMFTALIEQSPFHKLTYKFSEDQKQKAETYYQKILTGTE